MDFLTTQSYQKMKKIDHIKYAFLKPLCYMFKAQWFKFRQANVPQLFKIFAMVGDPLEVVVLNDDDQCVRCNCAATTRCKDVKI